MDVRVDPERKERERVIRRNGEKGLKDGMDKRRLRNVYDDEE